MEINVKCYFDNKPEFEKALDYLKPIVGGDMAYTGKDFDPTNETYYIETYSVLTQSQLDELTALCPIRPKREISKQRVYSKIAYGIGLHGSSYHPDDMLDDVTFEDCKILGLDPSEIAFELMAEFDVLPDHIKF